MSDDALQAYYALDKERDRLDDGAIGTLEFDRTIEILERWLPDSGTIADIGGGPGRYTDWLVERGHRVVHRDVVEHHVDQVVERHGTGGSVDAAVGDARSLDLEDSSVDAVLLLGPLYHLSPEDRPVALAEAARVVRPGGVVAAAVITRWSARLNGMLMERMHLDHPEAIELVTGLERTGVAPALFEGAFNGWFHTPEEFRAEVEASPLQLECLLAVESVAVVMSDLADRLADADERQLVFDALRAVESEPSLLGVSPHLIAVGRRPE